MEYKVFVQELKKYITGNSDWKISEENYRLYEDGYTSTDNEELSFIRHTNIKYNHIESDVLVVDPIGQGERLQLIDREGKPLTRGATTEHTLLNAGFNLLGTSLAAQEYWDNHRALDYLLTRKDIDSERIGVYGSSGGKGQPAEAYSRKDWH